MIANNGQEAVNQWLSVERGHYTIAIFDHVSCSPKGYFSNDIQVVDTLSNTTSLTTYPLFYYF
jgi:hypothetical protein